jgi:hypothetical protein
MSKKDEEKPLKGGKGKAGEEGKDEEQEEEKGCCDKFAACISETCAVILMKIISFFIN